MSLRNADLFATGTIRSARCNRHWHRSWANYRAISGISAAISSRYSLVKTPIVSLAVAISLRLLFVRRIWCSCQAGSAGAHDGRVVASRAAILFHDGSRQLFCPHTCENIRYMQPPDIGLRLTFVFRPTTEILIPPRLRVQCRLQPRLLALTRLKRMSRKFDRQ